MVGSSVLPACIHKGKLYFLFGRENSLADTPGWSDFGGGVETGENIYDTAIREGGEELTGFLGGPTKIQSIIRKGGGVLKLLPPNTTYHIHVFNLPYDPNLPVYYNNNHEFLWNRMNKKMLNKTKLFEKIEIQWFTVADMKKKRSQFRNFYRDSIVDFLVQNESKIKAFLIKPKTKKVRKSGYTYKNKSNKKL